MIWSIWHLQCRNFRPAIHPGILDCEAPVPVLVRLLPFEALAFSKRVPERMEIMQVAVRLRLAEAVDHDNSHHTDGGPVHLTIPVARFRRASARGGQYPGWTRMRN